MNSKIASLWRQFEAAMEGRIDQPTVEIYKAVFYAGAFACAWRIRKHLQARRKDDLWMAELMTELDDAIHAQAIQEFEEPVQ